MPHSERELALRAHIRALLLDYALTHLTTNYVAYTEHIVSEVLGSTLHEIPTCAATSVALEPTVHDQISACLKLQALPPFEDKWIADAQCLAFLKDHMPSRLIPEYRPMPGRRLCWEDDPPLPRPMSPILTASARKQTPQLGLESTNRQAASLAGVLRANEIKTVGVEDMCGQETETLDVNDALGLRIPIDAATHSELRTLLDTALPRRARNAPATHDERTEELLRSDSPSYERPRPMSPPIFSRSSAPGSARGTGEPSPCALSGLSELTSVLATPQLTANADLDVAEDDLAPENRYKQDMFMVDGCYAASLPSSPTPSLSSDAEGYRDKLYMKWLIPSSPSMHALPDLMDEHEIPRTEKIGSGRTKPNLMGDGKRLGEFLSFLQPLPHTPHKTAEPRIRIITTPKSQPSSPHTSITASLSMLGQPPTVAPHEELAVPKAEVKDDDGTELSSDDSIGLHAVLKAIDPLGKTAIHGRCDPFAFLLQEKLDESQAMLMDVPDLPPPNEYHRGRPPLPTCYGDLLMGSTNANELGFLKEIKGMHSLILDLNWRPFNFVDGVPTHEELARVDNCVKADFLAEQDYLARHDAEATLSRLLDAVCLTTDATAEEHCDSLLWRDEDIVSDVWGDDPEPAFVLTARERRKLYNHPEPVPADVSDGEYDGEGDADRPGKRMRPLVDECEANLPVTPFEEHDAAATQGLEDLYYPLNTDDSGIFVHASPAARLQSCYADLSDSARGFDGADDDLDALFADVDPVHFSSPGTYPFNLSRDCLPVRSSMVLDRPNYMCSPEMQVLAEELEGLQRRDTLSAVSVRLLETDREETQVKGEDKVLSQDRQSRHPNNTRLSETALPDTVNRALTGSLGNSTLSLRDFMEIRAKAYVGSSACEDAPYSAPDLIAPPRRAQIEVPTELTDNTLLLPDTGSQAATEHSYLASLEFLQRLGITRSLSSPACKVYLAERESLAGADVIVDPHCAIALAALRTLPTQREQLVRRVCALSWRFSRVLIVLEAVPADSGSELVVDPFSPPVVKAVKRLKRDLQIAEACLDKEAHTIVYFAFPMSTHAAARVIRKFGDMAHREDCSGGLLWQDRRWLELDEENPDERDLAAVDGMNVFAAATILSRNSLDEFLDKPAELRSEQFGDLVGRNRLDTFNKIVARRIEAMQLPSSSPPVTSPSVDSLNVPTPMYDDNASVYTEGVYY